MNDELLDQLLASIQRDVNWRGLASDPHDNLFTACRDDFAHACRCIADHPHPSLTVVTGFYIANADPPCGETDGPLGALFLARTLPTLGVDVWIATDSFCRRPLEIALERCGLDKNVGNLFETTPGGWVEERDSPNTTTHLVALERVGPGVDGRCRNMRGLDITDNTSPAHLLFEEAACRTPRVATIGIGDGGNEIGMGKIAATTIARNIPNGERIACRTPTDQLIVAGVSNWGAYALAAGVAVLRRQRLPASLFDVERERELLRLMVEQGPLVDGVTARPTVTVDALTFDDYAEPLRRIGELLEKAQCLSRKE